MKSLINTHPVSKLMKCTSVLFKDYLNNSSQHAELSDDLEPLVEKINICNLNVQDTSPNSPYISMNKVLESLGPNFRLLDYCQELIKDILKDKDIIVHYNRYYEDYKSLLVILGHCLDLQIKNQLSLFKRECDGIRYRNPQLSLHDSLELVDDAKIVFRQEQKIEVDVIVLRMLLMTYLMQILIEKVYINYYHLQHELMVEKIILNGIFLDLLAERYLNFVYRDPVVPANQLPRMTSRMSMMRSMHINHPLQFSREVDDLFVSSNFKRLLIIRLRRFYLNLVDYMPNFNIPWVNLNLEPILSRVIGYAGMVFFIPRLFINISYFVYHTYLYDDRHFFINHQLEEVVLTKQEKFQAQFERRWDLVVRDFFWFMNAFMGFMFFYGNLAVWSFVLNAVLQCSEAFLNLHLLNEYHAYLSSIEDWIIELNVLNNREQIRFSEGGLNIRWRTELEILISRLWNSVMICLSSIMIIPIFAKISLAIPFCGALLSIGMSVWQSTLGQSALEKRKLFPDPFLMKCGNLTTNNIQPSCISLAQP